MLSGHRGGSRGHKTAFDAAKKETMANGPSWLDILCCLCLVNALTPRRRERVVYVERVQQVPPAYGEGAGGGELPMISCATMVRSTDPQAI